jgi:hypothetical protein
MTVSLLRNVVAPVYFRSRRIDVHRQHSRMDPSEPVSPVTLNEPDRGARTEWRRLAELMCITRCNS